LKFPNSIWEDGTLLIRSSSSPSLSDHKLKKQQYSNIEQSTVHSRQSTVKAEESKKTAI
jgi:hypothetical protein